MTGRVARRVWFGAVAAWATVGLALVVLVVVRDNRGGCQGTRNQPAALGGYLALCAIALGLAVLVVALVAGVRAKRRGESLAGFWAASLVAAVAPLVAAALFVIYVRDTFTICF